MSKISTIYNVVLEKLYKSERYRDDDNLLVVSIWWNEVEKMGYDGRQMSAFQFMSLYKLGEITSADTITRARRKVQEEHPHLRGKSYQSRQSSTEDVKRELRKL
jgi:hypothetical protein